MLEKRNDVLCRLAVAEAGKSGMAAERPTPIRSAFAHGIWARRAAAVRAGAEERALNRIRFVGHGTRGLHADRDDRGHRCRAQTMSPRPRRHRRQHHPPPVNRPRRSGRRRGRRGPDANA